MNGATNIWAAPPEPVQGERLARGDVNVDIKCAVKLTALMRRHTVLPLMRVRWHHDTILDKCGRVRSSATIGANRRGCKPGNFGKTYEPTPPTDDEVLRLMAACGPKPTGVRDAALIGFLWRTGLRISEALDVVLDDIDPTTNKLTVRRGKGAKYGTVGIDDYGLELLAPWLDIQPDYADDDRRLFCVIDGPSRGDRMSASSFRTRLHRLTRRAGITKRIVPHSFRHALAIGMDQEGISLPVIQLQLRHSNPGITGQYLRSMSNAYVISKVVARPRPTGAAFSEEWQPS